MVDLFEIIGNIFIPILSKLSPNAGVNYGYHGIMAHILYETLIPYYLSWIFNPLTMMLLIIILEFKDIFQGGDKDEEIR